MRVGDRYMRHNLIDWFSQDALRGSRIAVIGAGAVGNEVVKNLALLGIGRIDIYDFDKIEEHNLTRSVLFRSADVGRSKAEVAAERARELDPNLDARSYEGDFWDLIGIRDARGFTAVFCCVDNFEARIRCNTLCLIAQVDLVVIGLDSRYGSVEVFPFGRYKTSACYECALPPSVYQRIANRYSCGWLKKVSFVEGKVPTTIVTSAAAASIAVSAGLRFGNAGHETSQKYLIDTISGTSSRSEITRYDGCPCCGRLPRDAALLQTAPMISELPSSISGSVTVEASDPILVSYSTGTRSEVVWEAARKFDDSFPSKVSADPDSVTLEIRDQFTLDELIERFSNRTIPCKFFVCRTDPPVIVEVGK